LLAINNFKNTSIIIVHHRMHSKLVHNKACDKRCLVMHSKGKKMPGCFESRNIASFKVCFNFIAVLPLTISNDRLRVILLARCIRPPFDNNSSTIKSLVHIIVHVFDGRYGRTYFHVNVRVVLGYQVKIVRDNPPVILHFPCSMHCVLSKFRPRGPCIMHEMIVSYALGWHIWSGISANTIKS